MPKKTVRENVESILKNYPETRDSDKLLILKYWEDIDNIPLGDFNLVHDFKKAFISNSTSTESIRRVRQLIQEEGKYLPLKESTVKARRKRQDEMFDAIVNERQVV